MEELRKKAINGLAKVEKLAGKSLQTTLKQKNLKIKDKEILTFAKWEKKDLPQKTELTGVGIYVLPRHSRLFQNLPVHILNSIVKEKQKGKKNLEI